MKLLAICMPALMLGAAAFVTPAFAADANAAASGNAAAAAPAQPAQDANSAAVPAQSAQDNSTASSQTAMNAQSSTSASGNTQMAMNSTGNAADLSSVPDNQHKYSRAKKASQNRSEDQTTKQLNQQEASLNGASSTSSAQ